MNINMTRWFKWQNALPAAQLRGGWGELRYSDYLDSVFWLYYRMYIMGPEYILPREWRNPRHF